MNNSGDAAEQIVRMSLEGVEVAARITGTAAKELALLIITALKSEDKGHIKLRGKERLKSMLKSGKPLEIYSLKERDLARFAKGAKEYGIVYCVLRNTKSSPDGLCDIMIKADDAPKIARVADRFKFATVDKAKIEREIMDSKFEKAEVSQPGNAVPAEQAVPNVGNTEKLVNDLLGALEGKAEPDAPELDKTATIKEPVKAGAEDKDSRPLDTGGRHRNPSAPISESNRNSAKGSSTTKPSVREEMREIRASQKAKAAETNQRDERPATSKPNRNPTTTHKQPQRSGKTKPTKSKGTR